MAFRRFGGLNYAPNNNIVHNTYSNTKNLTITNQVGSPNSNVLIQSNLDMSSNSLFGIGEAHFETGFITSRTGALTFDNSTSNSSGVDFNAGAGITLRGMDFNNAEGATFRFNTTGGGAISLHNQTVSVATGDINLTAPTGQTIFIDPLLTVPKITTRPGTDLFVSTGSSDGHIRVDRDVDIISDIIQIGDSLFQGNVGIIGTLGVTGTSVFDGQVGITGRLGVTGRSTFDGSVGVTGLFGVTGRSTFDGAVGITGLFGVTGRSVFNGSVGVTGLFGVTGRSTFDGSLGVTGEFGVTGRSTFDGQIGIAGLFDVTGSSTFDGAVGITGRLGITGASTFNGSVGITGRIGITGTSTFDGSVGIAGRLGVTGTSTFNGSIGVSGAFGVTGTSTFNGSIGVTGAFGVTGPSTFNGAVSVLGPFDVSRKATFNGGADFNGYVPTCSIPPTGDYDLTNKQYVLSLASGGGVTLFNNNNLWTGTNTFNNSVAVNGPFSVTGASVFNGSVNVKNVLTLDDSLALASFTPDITLSQTELSYLAGATGNIQTQIDNRVTTTTEAQAIAGVKTFSNLKLSGGLALTSPSATVTQDELSCLAGATGNIQTQLDNSLTKSTNQSISGTKTFVTGSAINFNDGSVMNFNNNSTTTFFGGSTVTFSGNTSFTTAIGGPTTTFNSNLTLGASSNLVLSSPNTTLTQAELSCLKGTTGGVIQNQLNDKVTLTGSAQTISSAKTFSNNTIFNGTAAFPGGITGNTTFNGQVGISGAFGVTGNSTFNGTVEFVDFVPTCKIGPTGDYDLTNKQYVMGLISGGGVALFNDDNTWTGTNTFKNVVGVSGPFGVTGASIFNGPSTFIGQVGVTGQFGVTGASIFNGSVNINNDLTLGGSSSLALASYPSSTLSQLDLSCLQGTTGGVIQNQLNNRVTLTGAAQTISSAKTFSSGTTFTGAATFSSDLTLGGSSNLALASYPSSTLSQLDLSCLQGTTGGVIQNQLNNRVTLTGAAQTISSAKTFTSDLTLDSGLVLSSFTPDITLSQLDLSCLQGTTGGVIQNQLNNRVTLTGAAQTISSAKTFSSGTTFTGAATFSSDLTLGGSSSLALASQSIALSQLELSYLDGATGNIQTQLGGKVNLNGDENINGNKKFNGPTTFYQDITLHTNLIIPYATLGSVTLTQDELSYLDTVSSNIQNQLNNRVTLTGAAQTISSAKTFTSGTTFTGNATFTTIGGTTATFTGEVKALSFDATSDYRIKQNVTNLGNTYTLDNLRPVSYYNIKSCCQDLGFLAHEVQQEIPHIVTGVKDGEQLQSINYNRLIPILVKELNEQKQENKQNKELINKLMQSNEYLMKHVNELIKKLL